MRKEISAGVSGSKHLLRIKSDAGAGSESVAADTGKGLHQRNPHRAGYNFKKLVKSCPALAPFVVTNPRGVESVNFADPGAVKALNKALLAHYYGVRRWDIPEGYLCPPVPGRADYVHHVADLLASCNGGVIPRGRSVHVLDVGAGASCIYPIIGRSEYGWRFLGTESDPVALESAQRIVQSNNGLAPDVQLRLQTSRSSVFRGVMPGGVKFDAVICNPPFHSSLEEAVESTRRKWRNLGRESAVKGKSGKVPVRNFGGKEMELCCEGGERGFVQRMIAESRLIPSMCLWFSALISKEANLAGLYHVLRKAGVTEYRTINMSQGQKRSRILAWTFLDSKQRRGWFAEHSAEPCNRVGASTSFSTRWSGRC